MSLAPKRKRVWVRDPAITKAALGQVGGAPPRGHVRQCQAARVDGEQCGRWAMKGIDYCKRHRYHQGSRKLWRGMGLYKQRAGMKLKALLDAQGAESPAERLSLLEEVDVARVMALRYVEIFENTCLPPDGEVDKASPELKAKAVIGLRSALDTVRDLALSAAKVRALSEATVDVEAVAHVIRHVGSIIEHVLIPEHQALADDILKRIGEIKLPERRGGITVNIT